MPVHTKEFTRTEDDFVIKDFVWKLTSSYSEFPTNRRLLWISHIKFVRILFEDLGATGSPIGFSLHKSWEIDGVLSGNHG